MSTQAYHFIGIGGIGMSGLAKMLLQQNHVVSGSDISPSYVTEYLIEAGASIAFGHAKEHVREKATVVYSTDISQDNPELMQAKEYGCPVWHRSDLLAHIMKPYTTLLVAGTHGKTTTTALLSHVFCSAGKDPSFAVGGMMHGLQCNAKLGTSDFFIAEADESDGTFLKYPYSAAIVTNIDTDHLAHYGNWNALVEAFKAFIAKASDPELLFYCKDDQTLASLDIAGTSYGFSEGSEYQAVHFRQKEFSICFDVVHKDKTYKDVTVSLTGWHNARNALAVFALSLRLGLDEMAIRHALTSFAGVKRRMEKKGEVKGVAVFDDYAHHPTEIHVTVKALRLAVGKRRLIAVFQPHRYSRMRFLLKNFAETFDDADVVLVTDLFTAKEAPVPEVTSESIYEEIKRHYPNKTYFIPRSVLTEGIAEMLRPGDVVLTMGAGDITKVGPELCEMI